MTRLIDQAKDLYKKSHSSSAEELKLFIDETLVAKVKEAAGGDQASIVVDIPPKFRTRSALLGIAKFIVDEGLHYYFYPGKVELWGWSPSQCNPYPVFWDRFFQGLFSL